MLVYILAPETLFPYRWGFGGCHADATSWYCIARRKKSSTQENPRKWQPINRVATLHLKTFSCGNSREPGEVGSKRWLAGGFTLRIISHVLVWHNSERKWNHSTRRSKRWVTLFRTCGRHHFGEVSIETAASGFLADCELVIFSGFEQYFNFQLTDCDPNSSSRQFEPKYPPSLVHLLICLGTAC